jgi:hypothetical protein
MTPANLATRFQSSILSHPTHDMAPEEYKLSQDVLSFLIENRDHFLLGWMEQPGPFKDAQPSEPKKQRLFGKFKAKVAHMKEDVKEWEAEREAIDGL